MELATLSVPHRADLQTNRSTARDALEVREGRLETCTGRAQVKPSMKHTPPVRLGV